MNKSWLLAELAGLCLLIGWFFLRPVPLPNRMLDTAVSLILSEANEAITPERFAQEGVQATMLDVRARKEYDISHLPGAIHVGEQGEYLPDSLQFEDYILVYCSIGKRSEKLMKVLQSRGFQRVRNLYGGIFAWAESGLPMESEGPSEAHVLHGYSPFWARLTTYPSVYLESN